MYMYVCKYSPVLSVVGTYMYMYVYLPQCVLPCNTKLHNVAMVVDKLTLLFFT